MTTTRTGSRRVQLHLALLLLTSLVACSKKEDAAPPKAQAPSGTGTKSSQAPSSPAGSAAQPASGDELALKVKWELGRRMVFRMDMDQKSTNSFPGMPKPMEQQVHMGMVYALTSTKELANGGSELEMEFVANEIEVKMGDQVVMSFDSKEASAADKNPFAGPYKNMIGTRLKMELNKNGGVDKVIEMDAWTDKVLKGLDGPARGMIGQQFNEGYFRQVADFGRGLPPRPMRIGESWPTEVEVPAGPIGKLKVSQTNTLSGWETHESRKTAAMTAKGQLTSSGGSSEAAGPVKNLKIESGVVSSKSWFDPELGMIVDSVSDQSMKVTGEVQGPPGAAGGSAPKFTSATAQTITVKLVEVTKAR